MLPIQRRYARLFSDVDTDNRRLPVISAYSTYYFRRFPVNTDEREPPAALPQSVPYATALPRDREAAEGAGTTAAAGS
jgi:hypothetical protein